MFGRTVDSVEDERRRPSIDELMLRAGWYNDQVTGLDVLVLAGNRCFTLSGCEGKDLVDGMLLREVRISRTCLEPRLGQDGFDLMCLAVYWLDGPHRLFLRLREQS